MKICLRVSVLGSDDLKSKAPRGGPLSVRDATPFHIVLVLDEGSKFIWKHEKNVFRIVRISEGEILYRAAPWKKAHRMRRTEFERRVLCLEIQPLPKG